jgi:hypothetical protein
MAKKKRSSCKHVIATSYGIETSVFLDQPAENNVHGGEEVVVVDNLSATPSTNVDSEAAKDARTEPELDDNMIS